MGGGLIIAFHVLPNSGVWWGAGGWGGLITACSNNRTCFSTTVGCGVG